MILIQTLFADKDDEDYKQYTENNLKTIALRDGESIFAYNKRFGYLYRNYQGCGLQMNDTEKARIYLRGLKKHPNSALLIEIKSMIKTLNTSAFMGLTEIQRLLLREEEHTQEPTSRQQPRTRKDRNGRPISRAYAATINKKLQNNRKQCHGCHKFGHFLKDCKTTAQADKKRIWDMIKASKSNPTNQDIQRKYETAQAARPAAMLTTAHKEKITESSKTTTSTPPKSTTSSKSKDKKDDKKNKTNVSFATMAEAQSRKRAYATMALVDLDAPKEGNVLDPYDVHPPPIYEDQIVENPNYIPAVYDKDVIIDSGTSDCMVPSFA